MTQYKNANVNLTENQIIKLKNSINANCAATSIKLGKNDLEGEHTLKLTNSQFNKLQIAKEQGKGITIRMSSKQLKHNLKTEGGFLGLLGGLAARALPALGGLASRALPALGGLAKNVIPTIATGALSGLASSGESKLLGNGLYLKKGGMIAKVEPEGNGLYLRPYKGRGLSSFGNGLYLKKGGKIYDGSGFLTDIPIVGDILKAIF